MDKLEDKKKHLRLEMTEPEKKLWMCLRNRKCGGIKFRRQFPIGPYVADFCSFEYRLVIEVDGDTHGTRQPYDAQRTNFLREQGYRVIRYTNRDIMQNITGVADDILAQVQAPSPSQDLTVLGPSLSRWERG